MKVIQLCKMKIIVIFNVKQNHIFIQYVNRVALCNYEISLTYTAFIFFSCNTIYTSFYSR